MNPLDIVSWHMAATSAHIHSAMKAAIDANNNRAFQALWQLARLIDKTSGKLAGARSKPSRRLKDRRERAAQAGRKAS